MLEESSMLYQLITISKRSIQQLDHFTNKQLHLPCFWEHFSWRMLYTIHKTRHQSYIPVPCHHTPDTPASLPSPTRAASSFPHRNYYREKTWTDPDSRPRGERKWYSSRNGHQNHQGHSHPIRTREVRVQFVKVYSLYLTTAIPSWSNQSCQSK